mmetsp:Transcript_103988/g.199547  ORF Transcript_103988/g.199547 Transcript_103988/m.199547 type:complete len:411 (+) Transcript_103988:52-1284(+)
MERVQTLVVGAGVVGLACARALARTGREVVVVEAAGAIGTGTSSRNSEVVHAGIYYPAGSNKARHCVQGAQKLLDFCAERSIAHRICGKLIVASSEAQRPQLSSIVEKAARNGVKLKQLTAADVQVMEPQVSCVAALHSPRTAVVDSHGFMQALQADAEDAGAALVFRTRIRPGGRLLDNGGVMVEVECAASEGSSDPPENFQLQAEEVVNCAGLAAPRVALALGAPHVDVPTPFFCRGSYYALQTDDAFSARPFSRLIYPVPEPNTSGLGIHATVDLAGQVRFGPDVEWLPGILPGSGGMEVDEAAYDENIAPVAYAVDTARSESFYEEVRRYWPGLPDGSLVADYCGIRPKLSGPGQPPADFQFAEVGSSGRASLLSLFGVESPGLTSSLSLAEEVLQRLGPVPGRSS